jgi:hypothetical protein
VDPTSYKGWAIECQSREAGDAAGWRAYVTVSRTVGGTTRTVPLSFTDARVFPTEAAADEAGLALARTWIDREG